MMIVKITTTELKRKQNQKSSNEKRFEQMYVQVTMNFELWRGNSIITYHKILVIYHAKFAILDAWRNHWMAPYIVYQTHAAK